MAITMKALCAAALASTAVARTSGRGASLRGGAASVLAADTRGASKPQDFGKESCPCIGIADVEGTNWLSVGQNKTDAKPVAYPAEAGSFCKAWDDGVDPSCKDGAEPGLANGFCGQQWCFVDACNCVDVDTPPHVSGALPGVVYKGMPLYYSYSTCGGEDLWTDHHNAAACTSHHSEDDCDNLGDGNCTWAEETRWGEQCLGWEAAGMCADLPKQSQWGDHDCPCVGFNGVNGTMKVTIDDKEMEYPGEVGSVCAEWDAEHRPDCMGDNKADWCDQRWCFVDAKNCRIAVKSHESTYLPGAHVQGHQLHYSYATCGGAAKPYLERKKDEHSTENHKTATSASSSSSSGQEEDYAIGVVHDMKKYSAEWGEEWRNE